MDEHNLDTRVVTDMLADMREILQDMTTGVPLADENAPPPPEEDTLGVLRDIKLILYRIMLRVGDRWEQ